MNVFQGNELNLNRELVRNACIKIATLLNVAMPDNNLIAFIFNEFHSYTPKTFKKCCIKITKTWEGRSFPGLPIWNKYMESVAKETAMQRISKLPEVPLCDKPSDEEWDAFHEKINKIC